MYKSYQTRLQNQAPKQSSVAIVVRKSTKSDQLILKFLLNYANSPIFPSHETISKAVGFSITTVKNALKRLRANGLLSWKQRWNNSCWYSFDGEVLLPHNLHWLRNYFIGFISILLLLPFYSYSKQGVATRRFNVFNLSKKQQAASHEATAYNAILPLHSAVLYNAPAGQWLYSLEKGEPNPKRTRKEFDSIVYNQEQHMQQFTEEQQAQLQQYPQASVAYATKKLTSDLLAGKAISNQFSYMLGICRSHAAEQNAPKREARGGYNKQQAPSRHIDQALLQPLSQEAQKARAQERKAEWESRHGTKEADAFYVPEKPVRPMDQPQQWYTPQWCAARLEEDTKILHLASKADQNNPYVRYSIPVIKERMKKCMAILDKPETVAQPSLFQDDEPAKLSYDVLDEILD